jgi:hypothetical protein
MKILFLEDRPSRQLQFLPNREKDVTQIRLLEGVNMPESNDCKEIIAQINQSNHNFEKDIKLIIVHKSALETRGLEFINNFCKEEKVKLVCFSGGISQLTYNNEDYEFLNINSTDFYTERLIPFLNNFIKGESKTLLELVNKEWKLSYMFLARQIIGSIALEKDEDAKFNLEDKLDKINNVLNFDFTINSENIEDLNTEIKKRILSL